MRACLALLFLCPLLFAESRTDLWDSVERHTREGKPKSAIAALDQIIPAAKGEKAWPEAVKAIARRIKLEGDLEGRKAEEKIKRLQAQLEKAEPEMLPVFEAILGQWYWHYFQQNRWRFLQRTQGGTAPGDDIETWDLARILEEIDRHFTIALADASIRSVKIEDWADLLTSGSVPDSYRPTLYDFLAYQALAFYSAGEQAGAKQQGAFVLDANTPAFDEAEAFLAWQIQTREPDAAMVKALRLYQELMHFHHGKSDGDAFVDADLARLSYAYQVAIGVHKDQRYKQALEAFIATNADHEAAARALHLLAQKSQQDGDPVEAHRLATRGTQIHPDTVGANQCYNLIQQIESKQIQLNAERVWTGSWPTIRLSYKNIAQVHFRLVRDDWRKRLQAKNRNPEQLDWDAQRELRNRAPAYAWNLDLTPTDDYQLRQIMVHQPDDIEPGFYYLLASVNDSFQGDDNMVMYTSLWVSDLALVHYTRNGDAGLEGFVLDAQSGKPIAGAMVESWTRERDQHRAGPSTPTDREGRFRLSVPHNRGHFLLASHHGHALGTAHQQAVGRKHQSRPRTQTVFFTDRAIYRPGQTIRYKGISIAVDTEGDSYRVLADEQVVVSYRDVNGKEIAQQKHQTNAYGSFSGSFTAPRDRAMGQMHLNVPQGPRGHVRVRVEEYKRPKFRVELEPPRTAAKLGEPVALTGRARAYTGAPVDGAMVQYRVVREVRYPTWWRWSPWWVPRESSQEIAHGVTESDETGTFELSFDAVPDPSASRQSEVMFRFTVYADVTDSAGETRSHQRALTVGFTALRATLSADTWQQAGTDVAISLSTTTLDGVPQKAKGTLKIHALRQPETVLRDQLSNAPAPYRRPAESDSKRAVTHDPNTWDLGDVIATHDLETNDQGAAKMSQPLPAGVYRAIFETTDAFGKPVKALLPIHVVDLQANQFAVKQPFFLGAPTWQLEPGESLTALWGSGYDTAQAFVEIEHRGKTLRSFWTDPANTQQVVEWEVEESMRGGFTLHVVFVCENRAYLRSQRIHVPWTNKQLTLKWEHMTDKLKPGQEETWTAIISGPDAESATAEFAATLFDASLDAFAPHHWQRAFHVFRQERSYRHSQFENIARPLYRLDGHWQQNRKGISWTHRSFPPDLTQNFLHNPLMRLRMKGRGMPMVAADAPGAAPEALYFAEVEEGSVSDTREQAHGRKVQPTNVKAKISHSDGVEQPEPDLSAVSLRTNLQETAFFFPAMVSDDKGEVRMTFTMPEALTEWKFMGFAHDATLRSGFLQGTSVTAKDLMVQPNPPRFLREGDRLAFTVKVVNQSDQAQSGTVRLTFQDARTLQSMDKQLGIEDVDQAFEIPAGESASFSWQLRVPDEMGFLQYKAVASTGELSDGEQAYLPVLSRHILVTESIPLPIRGKQEKTFQLTKLVQNQSDTLKHEKLVVQMVSNPSWYAVMALPYLMEFPHECSEQTFNRLYANALAQHIANADPKIRRIFDQWKGTHALDSPLTKNQDLKAVMLEETPWHAEADHESQARRNVGILFDDNRLTDELSRAARKLKEMQRHDGLWPWFPGGRGNEYITLYITTGFGRMRNLGLQPDLQPAIQSLRKLDAWIDEQYDHIVENDLKDGKHLSPTIAFYLYGRSFFLKDQPIAKKHQEAVNYFLKEAKEHWLDHHRQTQAHVALGLHRFGKDNKTPAKIIKSLLEYAKTDDEMGMFWREGEYAWWWYRAPIETQALVIELFAEVAQNKEAVEACKIWLLKQKQTQDWKTTKATADAVYALLLRGENLLTSDQLVRVSLGGERIRPINVEAGTGFYEQRFGRGEITPDMGQVTVQKVDDGIAWGSLHWQYLEDLSKITPHTDTPLTLNKQLFVKRNTTRGPALEAVKGALKVGDELVTRIVLQVDRDMEYVHMKDQRGSGVEPVNVLSTYKYQDGLAYYESTRDTASHFFIDYLPKGTYIFEYSSRVQHRGQYQSGMALIESMYAPEFNSHSESIPLEVE